MRGLIQRYGIPIALYTDRHSLQERARVRARRGTYTVQSCYGRARHTDGLRPVTRRRVERAAGTFQDRLVTELRLAGATTIEEANAVLKDFLVRFNARFGVPARHPQVAYRPLGSGVCLDTALCFRHSRRVARDNTVKYRWRTATAAWNAPAMPVVDMLEGLDGQLAVRYSQEAPPRPGILRSFNGSSSHGRPGLNGLSRRWEATLVALDAQPAMLTTAAPSVLAKLYLCHAGSPPRFRRQGGPLFSRIVDSRDRTGAGHPSGHGEEYMEAASPPMKRLRVDSA